jgi:Uma2 family endonuclease
MAVRTDELELKLVRRSDGFELDLQALQGLWTEEMYLALTDQTNHLIEFTDGRIEVLPMPTRSHQRILILLFDLFRVIVGRSGGEVLVAPLRLRIRPGKLREPDILILLDAADPRNQDAYWLGADLVVEIVSPDGLERDTEEKPRDYAEAGIPEYWIVNPMDATISVLVLDGQAYRLHGQFRRGERATSRLLSGFVVSVDEVFDAQ